MDIEAHRQEYLAGLQAEIAAAPPERSPADVATYLRSEGRDDGRLAEMIDRLSLSTETFGEAATLLLEILADDQVATPTRLAAMRRLAGAEFRPHRFAPFAAPFVEALRKLATHKDRELRLAALERLTLTNDQYAQKLLREGLENKRKPLAPAAKAIQLLAQDDHGAPRAVLRDLAQRSTGKVREEALRALSNDPRSAALLEQVAGDKGEKPQVRQIAAMGLKNASPPRFAKLARRLALDDTDDDTVRAAAVSGIAHTRDVADLVANPRFAKALEAAGSATKSRALKASIRRFAKARDSGS